MGQACGLVRLPEAENPSLLQTGEKGLHSRNCYGLLQRYLQIVVVNVPFTSLSEPDFTDNPNVALVSVRSVKLSRPSDAMLLFDGGVKNVTVCVAGSVKLNESLSGRLPTVAGMLNMM